MKTLTIKAFSDPGHGWFRVKRSLLHELGIAKDISSYSYQRATIQNDWIYLEEDCDAGLLLNSLAEHKILCCIHYHSTINRSAIRRYNSYHFLQLTGGHNVPSRRNEEK